MPARLEELDAAIAVLRNIGGAETGRLDSDNEELLALVAVLLRIREPAAAWLEHIRDEHTLIHNPGHLPHGCACGDDDFPCADTRRALTLASALLTTGNRSPRPAEPGLIIDNVRAEARSNVVALRPAEPQTQDETPDVYPDRAAADIIRTASAHLKRLAADTDGQMGIDPRWQTEAPRQEWFFLGVDNAVGGPAGRLAGLFGPRNARLFAHVLDRSISPTPGSPNPIPSEIFLCAHNIVRSLRP
ncbi:hypothetical protein [Streptomyces sp. NPDC002692]